MPLMDADGYLVDPRQWTEDIAVAFGGKVV